MQAVDDDDDDDDVNDLTKNDGDGYETADGDAASECPSLQASSGPSSCFALVTHATSDRHSVPMSKARRKRRPRHQTRRKRLVQDTDQVVEALSELCTKMSVMFEHMNDAGTSVSSSQSGIASLSGKTPGEAADIDDHARTRSFELTTDPGKGELKTAP